ncbi:N-acetylneuraminate synthase [Aquirufa antheringensis]|uniref:N-acetylneuraminate synthase n=1 Tax=Aquirufa antheringensis TaxID=2516559 RepID=UPI0022A98B64|nr:N-acetylneuraminate synthase [Aquirufa antheringensis]MCZ2484754.1 N-acetylneuraminate synthase [Aquirufa antheringensis]
MNKVIIIAEAGVNHNGDIELAKKLIDVAVEAGVDYVKFQTFKSESLVSKFAKKASYQIENTKDAVESQLQMLKKLELSNAQHIELVQYCNNKNISFFSTAFDLESLSFLKELGLNIVKIPSGEITNLPYLRKAASLFKEVIISTGMSSMVEIEEALDVFLQAGIKKNDITILHCNTEYPTPMSDVNLNAMLAIQKMLGVKVGYSDHTMGIEVPIASVAMGGTMIEKHFTLDRSLPGPDQLASLEPDELKNMVLSIRNIEKAIGGTGIKEPSESEIKNISIARKSIVAKTSIHKGDRFTEFNITTKRPGIGLSPMKWDEVIGKVACQDFDEDELINLEL